MHSHVSCRSNGSRLAGVSSCYRKEAGAHGKEAWGLYRTHEFKKVRATTTTGAFADPQVEQFIFTTPEKSWEAFDDMIGAAEEFYTSLGLPYRVVAIVSGALNNAASKKNDLEAWFPFQGEYKELVSCSNCTDYQSRALEIRSGQKTQTDVRKKYVHLLNCTLCATGRALCCLVENYQTDEVSRDLYRGRVLHAPGCQGSRAAPEIHTRLARVPPVYQGAAQECDVAAAEGRCEEVERRLLRAGIVLIKLLCCCMVSGLHGAAKPGATAPRCQDRIW